MTKKISATLVALCCILSTSAFLVFAAPRSQLSAGITTYNGSPAFKVPPLTNLLESYASPGDKYTGSISLINNSSVTYKIKGFTIVPKSNNITNIPRLGGTGSAVAEVIKYFNSSWSIPSSGYNYIFDFKGVTGKSFGAALKERHQVTSLLSIPKDTLLSKVFKGYFITTAIGTGPNDITQVDLDSFPGSFRPNGSGGYSIVESDPEMLELVSTFASREWLQFTLDNTQYPVNYLTTNSKPVYGKDYLDATAANTAMLNNLFPVGTELPPQAVLTFDNVAIQIVGQATNILSSTTIQMPFEIYITLEEVTPPQKYTVTFNSMGGSFVESTTNISADSLINAPANPTRNGFSFSGWYREMATTTRWNFSTDTVNSNITLYAKWITNDSPSVVPPSTSLPPSSIVPSSSNSSSSSEPSSSVVPSSSNTLSSTSIPPSGSISSSINSSSYGSSVPPTNSNPTNNERREETREQLIEAGVPTLQLGNTEVPLFGGGQKFVWSLLSLMLMISSVITATLIAIRMLIMHKDGQHDNRRIFKFISIAIGIISLISFMILYNLNSLMVFIDIKTILFALLLAAELLVLLLSKRKSAKDTV